MKKLILIICLGIFLCFQSFAQNPQCPSISVFGPKQLVKSGETMTFTVDVKGENTDKLEYKWTVSNGTIVSGQGTAMIVVATTEDMAGQTVTATVEIIGLPKDCPNLASATSEVESKVIGCVYPKGDEYGKILFKDEITRLKMYSLDIKKYDDVRLFFVFSKTKDDSRELLKIRLQKIEKYLIETGKLSKDRFLFVFGGFNNYETQIWFIPLGATPPDSDWTDVTQDNWLERFDKAFPRTKKSSRKSNISSTKK